MQALPQPQVDAALAEVQAKLAAYNITPHNVWDFVGGDGCDFTYIRYCLQREHKAKEDLISRYYDEMDQLVMSHPAYSSDKTKIKMEIKATEDTLKEITQKLTAVEARFHELFLLINTDEVSYNTWVLPLLKEFSNALFKCVSMDTQMLLAPQPSALQQQPVAPAPTTAPFLYFQYWQELTTDETHPTKIDKVVGKNYCVYATNAVDPRHFLDELMKPSQHNISTRFKCELDSSLYHAGYGFPIDTVYDRQHFDEYVIMPILAYGWDFATPEDKKACASAKESFRMVRA